MAKATIKDITQGFGFTAEQFGGAPNFDVNNGFVDEIINQTALEVRNAVGAALYDAAAINGTDSQQLDFVRIAQAEKYLVAAELWRRRLIFIDANMIAGRDSQEVQSQQQACAKNARAAHEQAWRLIALMGGTLSDYGADFGYIETGEYA